MNRPALTLSLLVAFLLGCATAQYFVVPPARAADTQRWEYFCFEAHGADAVSQKANEAGAAGWELVTTGHAGFSKGNGFTWCFKRPL